MERSIGCPGTEHVGGGGGRGDGEGDGGGSGDGEGDGDGGSGDGEVDAGLIAGDGDGDGNGDGEGNGDGDGDATFAPGLGDTCCATVVNVMVVLPPSPYASVYDTTVTSYLVPGAKPVIVVHWNPCTFIGFKNEVPMLVCESAGLTTTS